MAIKMQPSGELKCVQLSAPIGSRDMQAGMVSKDNPELQSPSRHLPHMEGLLTRLFTLARPHQLCAALLPGEMARVGSECYTKGVKWRSSCSVRLYNMIAFTPLVGFSRLSIASRDVHRCVILSAQGSAVQPFRGLRWEPQYLGILAGIRESYPVGNAATT